MKSPCWEGDFPVTQVFGVNRAAYAQFGYLGHNGIDIGCPVGTPWKAPENGKVTSATNDPQGYGQTIYYTGDSGKGWRYGHGQRLLRATGDRCARGDQLGVSGNTGNSTGPHLHIGVRLPGSDPNNGYGGYTDPAPYLAEAAEDDMSRIEDLEQQVADQATEIAVKAQQIAELFQQIAEKNSTIGALSVDVIPALEERIAALVAGAVPSDELTTLRAQLAKIREIAAG